MPRKVKYRTELDVEAITQQVLQQQATKSLQTAFQTELAVKQLEKLNGQSDPKVVAELRVDMAKQYELAGQRCQRARLDADAQKTIKRQTAYDALSFCETQHSANNIALAGLKAELETADSSLKPRIAEEIANCKKALAELETALEIAATEHDALA